MTDRPSPTAPRRSSAEAERAAFFARAREGRVNIVGRDPPESRNPAENRSTNWLNVFVGSDIFNHMVEHRLDTTFRALADPTRRGMLAALALGEKPIRELAHPYRISFAAAAKHVQVLESAGLVARRKSGRQQLCRLQPQPLAEADAWLRQWERFWTIRLDRLEALIESEKAGKQEREP